MGSVAFSIKNEIDFSHSGLMQLKNKTTALTGDKYYQAPFCRNPKLFIWLESGDSSNFGSLF